MVVRAFRRWGYRVLCVQSVTNIDDKVIARAAETGTDPLALSDRNFREYRALAERLGIRSVNYYAYSTDHLPDIVAQVQQLLDRGFAYVAADGSVYFSVARFPNYGRLSGQKVEALQPGARLAPDERKARPEDFVLWKAARPG
ncbi:cysteinyl-tRNA synthetase, partial [mine drainage metagenome]